MINNRQFKTFDLIHCPLKETNLIEASAGTGKTYTICGLYARLIIEKERSVSDILVVTFTEAATEELRDRIRKILYDFYRVYSNALNKNDDSLQPCDSLIYEIMQHTPPNQKRLHCLELAIRNFDEAAIYTIHGFCHRILQEHAFESGVIFDAELLTDASDLIQEIADDFFRKYFYEAHPLFIRYAQQSGHTSDMMREWVQFVISNPFVKLMPAVSCPDDQKIHYMEKQYIQCFYETKTIFESEFSTLSTILQTHEGLNRNRYKIQSIPKWMKALSRLFSDTPIPGFPDDDLNRFQAKVIAKTIKKGHVPPDHPFFDRYETFVDTYNHLKNIYQSKMAYIKKECLKNAHAVLVERKKQRQLQTFDDLLYYVHQAIENPHHSALAHNIRNTYRAALIDEFQDTDPLQYSIFYTIFNHPENVLYIIGDPKQAIYSFRGADLFAYLKGVDNADHRYTLDNNWRSSPLLVNAINTLFLNHSDAFVYRQMNYKHVSPALPVAHLCLGSEPVPQVPLQILHITNSDKPGKDIAKERAQEIICEKVSLHISRLLHLGQKKQAVINDQPVRPGDIAILVRKNKEARSIQQALQARGIPGVVYSQERVWESSICRDLAHILAAVTDYQNDQHLKSALTSAIIGIDANTLFQLIENATQWDLWVERFQNYHDVWLQKGFMVMFRLLMAQEKVRQRLLSLENGERLLTDILHISELLHQIDMEKKPGMAGLLEYFNRYRAKEQHSKHESHVRLETDENAVKIVTIHKSKGLQYKIVYCPFIYEGSRLKTKKPFVYHDPNDNDALTLPLTDESREECLNIAETEYLAENMRMLYVAVTRAQFQCYLVCGDISKSATSSLSWLLQGRQFLKQHPWTDDIVSKFESFINNMPKKTIIDSLKELSENSQGSIQLCFDNWPLPKITADTQDSIIHQSDTVLPFSCRTIQHPIDSSWRITSFSALTSKKSYAAEIPDHDTFLPTDTSAANLQQNAKTPDLLSIFSFPKGARPGTFLHDLLEHLNFQETNIIALESLIEEKLSAYGYDLVWKDSLKKLLYRVMHASLSKDDPNFRLCNIQKADRINELGFHFPVTQIQTNEISAILETIPWVRRSRIPLYSLDFYQVKGMMKGFIDMIFVYQNKYYIVDWKSNFLGPELKDYANVPMKRAILDHYYILQYYLYTIALHRYLHQRIKDYDYQTHFGGIFYIFLRGLDDKNSGNYGIFRDRPEHNVIMALDQFFKIGSHFFFEKTNFLSQRSLLF
ncbi:MAG: exodeoxyribonuclease V subunit beta [Candidatus Magnetomorum sp.]|nr:exodeoxyribonuclease V subunit beta [Candidatus Magnetomorum sp.]